MRRSAHVFYLAVFALLGASHANHAKSISSERAAQCAIDPRSTVSDACASFSDLERINDAVKPLLDKITKQTDFFSYYRLNLYNKKCPFWSDENGMCGNIACAVNTLENEEDIPIVWRAEELGKLEGPKAEHPSPRDREERNGKPLAGSLGEDTAETCVVEYDDECDERDYCVLDDEGAAAKGDYVSLVDNPERFTGYAGAGAQQVWEAIYRENCFSKPKKNGFSSPPMGLDAGNQAALDLRNVMRKQPLRQSIQSAIAHNDSPAGRVDQLEFDDECVEKRVFHRVVSGMHASISTHLCWDFLNQTTGQWGPNLACYEERLHHYPDRISNLYFNYALVLRAVGKLRNHLQSYQFCSADPLEDKFTKQLVTRLTNAIPSNQRETIFDESVMFADSAGMQLKEDFKQRFRNVSRIMDCVGCDKCRLWGKLQTNGYGTALKVLFEYDEQDVANAPPLRQTELVALINTLGRISHSLASIKNFRRMVAERDDSTASPPPSSSPSASAVGSSTAASSSRASGSAPSSNVVENMSAEPYMPTPLADAYAARQSLEAAKAAEQPVEDDDDGYPEFLLRPRKANPTIAEAIAEEAELIWKTSWWILGQWAALPGKLIRIFIVELSRLWDFWLGLPVKPRSWELRVPRREDVYGAGVVRPGGGGRARQQKPPRGKTEL
ncbi:endoplasmic reticulum Oxidoreductin 1-domain-containing protein [Phyllosticta citricarpa]|uniref:Endoplasmic reticulum Oxidoreductin 1-domain-containing protein n=1 Tax=Phyllosticta paracitricarpa TaxID=2016321 RepID=A0ABR1N4A5_9PEZI